MITAILLLEVVGQFVGGNLADRFKKEKLYTVIFNYGLIDDQGMHTNGQMA